MRRLVDDYKNMNIESFNGIPKKLAHEIWQNYDLIKLYKNSNAKLEFKIDKKLFVNDTCKQIFKKIAKHANLKTKKFESFNDSSKFGAIDLKVFREIPL